MKKLVLVFLLVGSGPALLPAAPAPGSSQPPLPNGGNAASTLKDTPLSFAQFLQAVADHNLSYAAQKFNVPMAEAQVSLARLWPNPSLSVGATTPFHQSESVTVDGSTISSINTLSSSYTASLSQTFLLGGKLGAKEAAARANVSVASAQLDEFFRTLRATAADAYIDALTAQMVLDRKRQSYQSLKDLADLNQIRLEDGSIAEVDFLEARVAALQALNDLRSAESTLRQATTGLALLVGRKLDTRVNHPQGKLDFPEKKFDERSLIATALSSRSDVRAALRLQEYAAAQLQVVKSARVPDVTAALNYTHNTSTQNAIAPSPANDQVGLSLQFPIPLANFNTDDVQAANLTFAQAQRQAEMAQVQAETDVRQAIDRYHAAHETVRQYSGGILKDAERVFEIALYSYKKGKASLLDVRQAESDLNATYQSFYTAQNEEAKSLVNLEQAAGVWDLTL